MHYLSSFAKPVCWLVFGFLMPSLWGQSFQNVATEQGIYHSFGYHTFGGGVSFFDFSGDGLDDLSFASDAGQELEFFRNMGLGFIKVSLSGVSHTGASRQLLWVDMDNDGDQDLYVTASDGPNHLFRNTGNLQFVDITAEAGLSMEPMPSYGACWGDYDRDGWLDLFATNRMLDYQYLSYYLYHNNGDGTFTDVTHSAGVVDSGKATLTPMFVDINGDLAPEIYVAQDKMLGNTLFRNQGDGTFSDISASSGADVIVDGMGLTIGDYDQDGDLDMYMSNTPPGNVLLRNNGDETFTDVAPAAGVGLHGTGWGVNFVDVDHDSDLDLYASALHFWTNPQPGSALFVNQGNASFLPTMNDGMQADTVLSYGNAVGDFNRDGYPDIAVNNLSPYLSSLWKNNGGNNRWFKYRLQGTVSNRAGIGTWVEVYSMGKKQLRFSHCGTSFLSQNSQYEMVGLGSSGLVDSVIVRWPSGLVDHFEQLTYNQSITLTEGSTISAIQPLQQSRLVEMALFPNPAQDQIVLAWTLPQSGLGSLRLIDLRGKVLATKEVRLNGEMGEEHSWILPELSAGSYLVEYRSEKGVHLVQRFLHW